MQLDMHYYGTYAMARAAGLKKEVCETIATAAQFVDDNAEKESVFFKDGARLDAEATAHHTMHLKNLSREDQRQIWVPFHFLPGNEGDSYTQRLVCKKDSEIAQEMIKYNVALLNQPFALPLLGITAHVYADTFAHYGFSGVSSRHNKIVNNSIAFHVSLNLDIKKYITDKAKKFVNDYPKEGGFFHNIKSWLAEEVTGALGHGAVMTYPDRPFLVWNFVYENNTDGAHCPVRNNPETYVEFCVKIHEIFQRVAKEHPDFADKASFMDFSKIESTVKEIINLQAPKEGRVDAWKKAARNGLLFGTGQETIPDYDENVWHNNRDNLKRTKGSRVTPGFPVYRFYQAAAVHRINILRHILPAKELIVA